MSIGYATINSINLNINGSTIAQNVSGIIIEEVNYVSSNNSDVSSSKVSAINSSVLSSTIVLSSNDAASSITYSITLYNSYDYNYRFIESRYDSVFYDNQNIVYELSGINTDTIIKPKERTSFNITFKYKEGVTPTSIVNTLNSYIQFIFEFSPTVVGEFDYTGDYQIFTVLNDGYYKIEAWGAQGGEAEVSETKLHGGYGGYSLGELNLSKNQQLYIAVGGTGQNSSKTEIVGAPGGYNGGGNSDGRGHGSGGGATSIYDTLLNDGQLVNYENNKENIVLVAGGGGGGQVYNTGDISKYSGYGGSGGGYIGGSGQLTGTMAYGYGTGGTQESGGYVVNVNLPNNVDSRTYGSFGQGASVKHLYLEKYLYSSGGGGGYYGGGAVEHGPAGGGSGYIGYKNLINKYMYCNACEESEDILTKTIQTEEHSQTPISNTTKEGNGYVKITLMSLNYKTMEYETFDYTGDYQKFTAPYNGLYKIELWGAKGTDDNPTYNKTEGGNGAYTAGEIELNKDEILYIYVGPKGTIGTNVKRFNSGTTTNGGWSGGGATDVRLTSGEWDSQEGLKNRIMVAAGGGTKYASGTAGAAGGLVGYNGGNQGGGTQTSFEIPNNSAFISPEFGIANGGCTGGNGYYPGTASACGGGSPGGSSFISGHNGCVAIESSTSLTPRLDSLGNICTDGTTDITCSYHYSGYKFSNTVMIDGLGYQWTTEKGNVIIGMPTFDGTSTMNGNDGNGYAKITLLKIN